MRYGNQPLVRTSPNHLSPELVVEDGVGAIWLNRPDRHNAFDVRSGSEAQEGIAAFFAKRKPRWTGWLPAVPQTAIRSAGVASIRVLWNGNARSSVARAPTA